MVGVKLGQIILFAVMFDLIYPNIDYDNEGVEEHKSAIICYLFIFNFIPSFTHSISIACEGQIVRKEIKEGMYSIVPYYIEKFVIELPIVLITVLVLIFSTYYVVDLNQEDSSKVINLVFIGIMTYIHGFTIGIVASAISVNPLVAYVVGGTLASSFMMFSGFFNDPENGPAAFGWIKFLIPNYYLRNAALINEFDDLDLDEDVELSPDDRYSYDHGTIWGNILVTFIHFFAMFFIAILISNLQIHRKRVVRKN